MLVAGFDTETTGLDTAKESIIEVGVVLWDTDRKAPLIMYSAMLDHRDRKPLEPRITELTGITDDDLGKYGRPAGGVLKRTEEIFAMADAVVAHNGNLFDKPMFEANCERLGVPIGERLWADTSCDIEYPPAITTRRQVHLAAEHGFLNPFAHRALFDVLTMLKITTHYDWEQIIRYAKSPTVTLIAETTFAQKELPKKQNFRWNPDAKKWTKSVKDFQADEEVKKAKEAGFEVKVTAQ